MIDLKNLFKGISFKSDARLFGLGEGPEADWKFIFMASIVLVFLSITLNTYVYLKVDKEDVFVEEPVHRWNRSLDLAKLRETTSYYEEKARVFKNINSVTNVPIDPSI